MARVALVTGGTRGIGAAISRMLKLRGYVVAANYAGNDVAADAFKEANGIAVYKFDVSDFAAVATAVTQIEKDLGRSTSSSTMRVSRAIRPCGASIGRCGTRSSTPTSAPAST